MSERVVRHAHCHALVVRPSPKGKVLAATDFSDPAFPAVAAAAGEARRRKADFVILNSIDILHLIASQFAGIETPSLVDVTNEVRKASRDRLDQCASEFKASEGRLTEGPAAAAICEAARGLPAELVVVGTRGRTALSRLALGSVAEAVVRDAPCSVLVVRLIR